MLQVHGVAIAWLILLHFTLASAALLLGIVQLVLPKGTPRHRLLGRSWAVLVVVVALSSFDIRELRPGSYSWIHLLSIWTLFCLPAGIFFIRRGDVRRHRNFMVGTFIGLLVAGGFALFGQDRLLHRLLG